MLKYVKVYHDAELFLLSVTKELSGVVRTAEGKTIVLKVKIGMFKFDPTIDTLDSILCGVRLTRIHLSTAMPMKKANLKVNIS